MNDFSSLSDTLSSLAAASGRFVLDRRSTEQLLRSFSDYAALIPFDELHSWAEVFFSSGATPESLSLLFDDPSIADAALPPHQAFMLGFLALLKTPRTLLNHFPAAHRDLYYRGLLGVGEKSARPDSVVLGFTLKSDSTEQMIPRGTLFDGGQDKRGTTIQYALDDSLLVNRGTWSDLRWCLPASPDAPGGPRTSDVLFDSSAAIAWPKNGVHLFDESRDPQTVLTGRMVGSALLAMSAGTRTITLTFAAAVAVDDLAVSEISAGDSWIRLSVRELDPPVPSTLEFVAPATAPPISPPSGQTGLSSSTPLLKLGRKDGQAVPRIIGLAISAVGIGGVQYSTDEGVSRLDGCSDPFGQSPVLGSGFNLIAADWCGRAVQVELTLTPHWLDLPAMSFPGWYVGYPDAPVDNGSFTILPLLASSTGTIPLAGPTPAAAGLTVDTNALSIFQRGVDGPPQGNTLTITLPQDLIGSARGSPEPRNWPQWVRLELSGMDFLHDEYLKLAGTAGVNPPYTPQINGMDVSYSAIATDIVQSVLTPFGSMQNDDSTQASNDKLHLYLGFSDLQPGDTLSLYWQLQSPSGLDVSWQYLNADNLWLPLDDTLVDGTHGLLGSGLWSAILPSDASTKASQMPVGRYWVRGLIEPVSSTASSPSRTYPMLMSVMPNSTTATLSNVEGLDPGHFMQPLPADTIQNAATPLPGIDQVHQPGSSYGGAPPESPSRFLERIAGRLSHRNRALTWMDIQVLLKEKFASVFGIGIPSVETTFSLPSLAQQSAVVVPVSGMKDNDDPLRPMLSEAHLQSMAEYLVQIASAWADIVFTNPVYRTVSLDCDVTFKPGVNHAYAERQLTRALEERYMPWSWDQRAGVSLGNGLDYYAIVAFIQRLSYVERVNSLTLDSGRESIRAMDGEVLILGPGADAARRSIDWSGQS